MFSKLFQSKLVIAIVFVLFALVFVYFYLGQNDLASIFSGDNQAAWKELSAAKELLKDERIKETQDRLLRLRKKYKLGKDQEQLAMLLEGLCDIKNNDCAKALDVLDRAYQDCVKYGDPNGKMAFTFLEAQAEAYIQMDKFQNALDKLDQARKVADSLNSKEALRVVESSVAQIYYETSQYEKSLSVIDNLIASQGDQMDDANAYSYYDLRGRCLQKMKNWAEAELNFQKSLDRAKLMDSLSLQSVAETNLALILLQQGKVKEALSLAEHALSVEKSLYEENPQNLFATQYCLAKIYAKAGRRDEAKAMYEAATLPSNEKYYVGDEDWISCLKDKADFLAKGQ